jgi:hypothetical protein
MCEKTPRSSTTSLQGMKGAQPQEEGEAGGEDEDEQSMSQVSGSAVRRSKASASRTQHGEGVTDKARRSVTAGSSDQAMCSDQGEEEGEERQAMKVSRNSRGAAGIRARRAARSAARTAAAPPLLGRQHPAVPCKHQRMKTAPLARKSSRTRCTREERCQPAGTRERRRSSTETSFQPRWRHGTVPLRNGVPGWGGPGRPGERPPPDSLAPPHPLAMWHRRHRCPPILPHPGLPAPRSPASPSGRSTGMAASLKDHRRAGPSLPGRPIPRSGPKIGNAMDEPTRARDGAAVGTTDTPEGLITPRHPSSSISTRPIGAQLD